MSVRLDAAALCLATALLLAAFLLGRASAFRALDRMDGRVETLGALVEAMQRACEAR